MITIIHGDDIVLSRKYLQEKKQKSIDPYVFDGIIDIPAIAQITQGSGLFSTEKNVFIENFFSKNKLNSIDAKNLIKYINKNESSLNIFFWEAKVLEKRSITIFNNPAVKTFKISQTIFLFLDSIKPANFKSSITLFHKALQNTVAELIFFMLQRQFRLLLALCHPEHIRQAQCKLREGSHLVRDSSPVSRRAQNDIGTIDELVRLAPWQKSKLERQAKYFSTVKLLNIYKKLLEIDLSAKTGNLPYSYGLAIDFLLLDI